MARSRTWTAAIAVVCAFTLTAGLAACSSSDGDSSGGGGNTTGVTDTSIKIGVAVSDLDGLRAAGMALAPALTTQNLSKRLTSYFDEWNAAGGINGRQVEGVVMTWDPVKPATAQRDLKIHRIQDLSLVPTGNKPLHQHRRIYPIWCVRRGREDNAITTFQQIIQNTIHH
jgi:hypothetical protein